MIRNGSVPQTPASTGVSLTIGQHLAGHLHDDGVGVAVGQQAGQRAAARHSVAAGVVDDDEVGSAGFGTLRREAGAGPGADDHAAGVDRSPCSFAPAPLPFIRSSRGLRLSSRRAIKLSAIALAKAGSLMSQSISTRSTESGRLSRISSEEGGVGVGIVEGLAFDGDHRYAPSAG